jgi:hypothetical protein
VKGAAAENDVDDRLRIFVFALAGAAVFGLLGAAFGAIAGGMMRASGRAAGGWVGNAVAAAFVRVRGRSLSPVATGVIVGGTDGACFLGALGTIFGGVVGALEEQHAPLFSQVALAGTLLTAGGVFFGCLGYALVRAGVWVVALVFVLAAVGGLAGLGLGGVTGLFYGALAGALVGSIAGAIKGGASSPADDGDESV